MGRKDVTGHKNPLPIRYIDKLPNEVFEYILSRLPAKTTLMCKLVCKAWFQAGDKSRHRGKYGDNNDCIVAYCVRNTLPSHPPRFKLLSHLGSFDFELNWPGIDFQRCTNLRMLTFHGILCLFLHIQAKANLCPVTHICWWCPSLRRIRYLPQSPFPLSDLELPCEWPREHIGFGFCLVKRSDQVVTAGYRVVKIVLLDILPTGCEIEVFNAHTNTWSIISTTLPTNIIFSDFKRPVDNGRFFCWLVGGKIKNECDVMCFDFCTETFITIDLPKGISKDSYLAVTKNDSLTVVNLLENGLSDVWVMREFGFDGPWIRLHTLDPSLEPMISVLNDGVSFLYKGARSFRMHNTTTLKEKKFEVEDSEEILDCIGFKESLPIILMEKDDSFADAIQLEVVSPELHGRMGKENAVESDSEDEENAEESDSEDEENAEESDSEDEENAEESDSEDEKENAEESDSEDEKENAEESDSEESQTKSSQGDL